MATGTARYLRYILFAFFVGFPTFCPLSSANTNQGLAVLWFISSSSNQRLPTTSELLNGIPKAGGSPAGTASAALPVATAVTPNIPGGLPPATSDGPRMNATFVTLARNSDLWEIARSIRQVEDRFNKKFHYDWVFLMCRFESGFFFRQPLMNQFEWYWRVEPSVELFCDIDYDVFKFMADNKKKYSFVLSLYEYVETIPTLWESTKKFMKAHPEHIAEGNSMGFLSDDGGETYNHCHMVSLLMMEARNRLT
jgi:hypothetical protein